jgi:hypothetical protein
MNQWTSGCGRIVLSMSLEQACGAYHPGRCDDEVRALSEVDEVSRQLTALDPALVREELKQYGARDEAELADHEQNLQRLLWLAAGSVTEGDPDA